jgi:GNAT superfamily N-acetyltransferase
MLFVDPPAIGRGVGRVLLDDALRYASRLGWSALRIESDEVSDRI